MNLTHLFWAGLIGILGAALGVAVGRRLGRRQLHRARTYAGWLEATIDRRAEEDRKAAHCNLRDGVIPFPADRIHKPKPKGE